MAVPEVRPLGVGQIIDRSFQLYRKHFVTIFLMTLLVLGPVAILQSLLTPDTMQQGSWLSQFQSGKSMDEIFRQYQNLGTQGAPEVDPGTIIQGLLLSPIMILVAYPLIITAVFFLVGDVRRGETAPRIGELLGRSFRRLGALAGSTFLFGLAMLGIYLALVLLMILLVVGLAAGGVLTGPSSTGGIILIIGAVLLLMFALAFFTIRFGYYLPFVALKETFPGLGRSWSLTRSNFWRLFFLMLLIGIITSIFTSVTGLLIGLLLGTELMGQLLSSLIGLLIMPMSLIPYAISFYDLLQRKEGAGLQQMIDHTVHGASDKVF